MPRKQRSGATGDRDRLEHMLQAARDAILFAHGRTREDLDTDAMLRRALVNCFQVIGEAAAQVSDEGRSRAPALPWPKMVGMRHILVHAYFNIDLDAVWRVVDEHLPTLINERELALQEWDASAGNSDRTQK